MTVGWTAGVRFPRDFYIFSVSSHTQPLLHLVLGVKRPQREDNDPRPSYDEIKKASLCSSIFIVYSLIKQKENLDFF
jgi:hypothetical protein